MATRTRAAPIVEPVAILVIGMQTVTWGESKDLSVHTYATRAGGVTIRTQVPALPGDLDEINIIDKRISDYVASSVDERNAASVRLLVSAGSHHLLALNSTPQNDNKPRDRSPEACRLEEEKQRAGEGYPDATGSPERTEALPRLV